MKDNTTWRQDIEAEAKNHGDPMANFVVVTCKVNYYDDGPAGNIDMKFDHGYGGNDGCAFTAWTDERVYFPVVYDGSEWVGSVPRNPCDVATEHMGGQ